MGKTLCLDHDVLVFPWNQMWAISSNITASLYQVFGFTLFKRKVKLSPLKCTRINCRLLLFHCQIHRLNFENQIINVSCQWRVVGRSFLTWCIWQRNYTSESNFIFLEAFFTLYSCVFLLIVEKPIIWSKHVWFVWKLFLMSSKRFEKFGK